MPAWAWIVIIVAVIVVLALMFMSSSIRRRRTSRLQGTFGPEYDHVVDSVGDRRQAEAELREREQRHRDLEIVSLKPAARDRYLDSWRHVQERFVDAPIEAVGEADTLVMAVMRERGYPVDDFEQRAGDISVDHPGVVADYRAAHDVSRRADSATTEDLRRAMLHYRTLFEELLQTEAVGAQS